MSTERASKKAAKPATGKAAKTDGDDIEARMREILDEAASIKEMAVGWITKNRNRTKRKDGSVHVSKEHYTFKYRGAGGGWKWKRVPACAVGRLRGLVKNGRRFMELEAEYVALATELALSGKKKRLPRRLPRPEMANVGELVGKLEKEAAGGGVPACAEDVDRMLAKAASEDMAAFFARLVESFLLRRGRRRGGHSIRGRNVLTVFGTARVRYPYFRKKGKDAAHPLEEFGIRRGMTARMREVLPFCGSEGGSFASGRDILRLLTGADVSVSRLRAETLLRGNKCRKTIEAAAWDVREYPDRPLPEGCRRVPRTLVAMADGTCVPCVRADLVGIKGKNGEAGSRQVRVIRFFEFDTVTAKGRPVPIARSSSFAATPSGMEELKSLVRRLGIARGSGTAPRMQCVADGEPALESMFRVDFPHAEFTNDFFHACEYLNKCIEAAGAADVGSEFKKARGILLRKGAEEAVKHIRACCADGLARSEEARSALEYLEKRKENMKYGKLRKEGLCISSSLIESTARILAGRCKRAGMHWRLENAVAVASIIAMRRSAV